MFARHTTSETENRETSWMTHMNQDELRSLSNECCRCLTKDKLKCVKDGEHLFPSFYTSSFMSFPLKKLCVEERKKKLMRFAQERRKWVFSRCLMWGSVHLYVITSCCYCTIFFSYIYLRYNTFTYLMSFPLLQMKKTTIPSFTPSHVQF